MKNKLILFLLILPLILLPPSVMAHCPLCTIGAGAAAGTAVWLGVSKVVVALFIGAFAMSMGMWFSKIPKKQYVPFQKTLIITVIFLTTVLPLMPIFSAVGPFFISFIGDYGKTYALNYSLASAFFGGAITFVSPKMSSSITKIRKGRMIPFQGVILTLALLIIIGGIIQLSL